MGAWGFRALESDNGLDVVKCICNYISTKYPNTEQISLTLAELLISFKEEGLLGQTSNEIDFLYDNSAMALTELYLTFRTTGRLPYENEEDKTKDLKNRVGEFIGDKKSFHFLLQHLTDIKNEIPDKDSEREIIELWRESNQSSQWTENLDKLIEGLKAEMEN